MFWQTTLLEKLGLKRFGESFSIILKLDYAQPISDENVMVMDTTFSDIPVYLCLPKRKSESQRPTVIFFPGGAFVLGSYCKCFLYMQICMSTCVCVCYTLYVFILKYIAVYTYWKNFRWYNVYVYKHVYVFQQRDRLYQSWSIYMSSYTSWQINHKIIRWDICF